MVVRIQEIPIAYCSLSCFYSGIHRTLLDIPMDEKTAARKLTAVLLSTDFENFCGMEEISL